MAAARARGVPSGARSSSAPGSSPNPLARRHRHERQDDDERAPRRDLPGRRPAGRGRRQRRPPAHRPRRRDPEDAWSSASSRASSSRTSRAPAAVAVLLNVTPDHLDRHGDLDAYRAAKLRIFENQAPEDVAVVPRGFPPVPGRAAGSSSRPTTRCRPSRASRASTTARTPPRPPPLRARPASPTRRSPTALASFAGVPHRLELVREVAGVRFVNDSKATNPEAAERALGAYPPGLRVILGGSRKGRRSPGSQRARAKPESARAYLIGESADELAEALAREGVRFRALRRPRAAVARRLRRRRARRGRAPLARLRELRPVRELRGARRALPRARGGAVRAAGPRRASSTTCSSSSRSGSSRSGS